MAAPTRQVLPPAEPARGTRSDLDISDRSAVFGGLGGNDEPAGVAMLLRRAASIIDRLWNEARHDPGDPLSSQLGAASRDLHRALMVLDDPRPTG